VYHSHASLHSSLCFSHLIQNRYLSAQTLTRNHTTMSGYAPKDPFPRATPAPFDDSDEGDQGQDTNDEDSDESGGGKTHTIFHTPPGQPTPSDAGLAAAAADFDCHDNPVSEITCIRNRIRGIQNWSETVDDTGPIRDMLARLKDIAEFMDVLMEQTGEENEIAGECLTKMIIKAREEVVGIGLGAKGTEVVQKHEELDLGVLEAMVKEFVGDMVEKPGAE